VLLCVLSGSGVGFPFWLLASSSCSHFDNYVLGIV
jgi:hypothetical protein